VTVIVPAIGNDYDRLARIFGLLLALAMNPHSIDAWSAIAWIDLALGKNKEAKSGFEELVKFDPGRKAWVIGLSMARAHNSDIKAISQFFSLPPLDRFEQPLPVDPAPEQSVQTVVRDGAPVDSSEQSKK
jgi:hypothetical protein